VVPKTELLDVIWGDRFVSESTLTNRIKSARKAVGDTGRDQRVIRTVHTRGIASSPTCWTTARHDRVQAPSATVNPESTRAGARSMRRSTPS
jgi:DNA-binding winged helix-turn-helix (wHTH) protein